MGSAWKQSDLKALVEKGKLNGDCLKKANPVFIPKNKPKGILDIMNVLKEKSIHYVQEFVFSEKRKYRSDFYVPAFNLLIEYEGIYSEKSRHTHFGGYVNDVRKYNQAVLEGYILLRYTAANYSEFKSDLEIIEKRVTTSY